MNAPLTPPPLVKLLNQKLLNWGGLFFLVGCLTLGSLFFMTARSNFDRDSKSLSLTLARYVEGYVDNAIIHLDHISLDMNEDAISGSAHDMQALERAWKTSHRFSQLLLIGPDRTVIASVPSGVRNVDFPVPMTPVPGSPLHRIGPPMPIDNGKSTVIHLANDMQNGYTLVGALKLDTLQNHLAAIPPTQGETIILTDRWGTVIAHPDRSSITQQQNIGYLPYYGPNADFHTSSIISMHDTTYISYGTVIPSLEWVLVDTVPMMTMYRNVMLSVAQFLGFLLITYIVFSVSFAMEMRRALLAPFSRLTASMRRLAGGDYAHSSEGSAAFQELAELRQTFNDMAHTIHLREQELAAARQYVKNIVDSMPSIVIGLDADIRIQHINAAAEAWCGIEEQYAAGRELGRVFPHLMPLFDDILEAMDMMQPKLLSKRRCAREDSILYQDILIYPLVNTGARSIVLRVDDVTSRVRMEEMMIQTEKMMSVGGLAAGMAHEINNPLGAIVQGAQNIERRISDTLEANHEAADRAGCPLATIRAYLEDRQILLFLSGIREAGMRAGHIVSNMLNFSRASEAQRSTIDLHQSLDRTIELASNDYDLKKRYDFRALSIIRDFDPSIGSIICSRGELEQVILNLLRNAAQAIHTKTYKAPSGPQITLRTRLEENGVCIEVEDNGPGMDETIRKRVFEPFFTTKDVGEGTGLGLSVSYFIITENHRGSFDVTSTPGMGSKFTIRLPMA